MDPYVFLFAGLGGVLPALLWLWFWLREDARHPEPKTRIALTFLGGMGAVLLVLPLEKATFEMGLEAKELFVLWAAFEELLKLFACYAIALRHKDDDEPVDALIYMLTAALGFTAMENTLFLLNPIAEGNIVTTLMTGNLRFMGASLLHVLSSGAIGAFIALSFYKSKLKKAAYLLFGVVLSIVLHAQFNLFIIKETDQAAFTTFGIVWAAIIVLMLIFEKVKTINPRK